jgi:phage terminase large subunit-like protein
MKDIKIKREVVLPNFEMIPNLKTKKVLIKAELSVDEYMSLDEVKEIIESLDEFSVENIEVSEAE